MFLILQAREKAGFAQPIDLNESKVRKKLSGLVDQFRRHWRSAVSQDLETAQVKLPDFRELDQQIDHRRHQNGVSDALAFYGLAEGSRAELRNRDLISAECRSREHGRKIGDVEDWRRVQIDSAFWIAHPVVEIVDVRQDIGMSHYNALRPTSSPAGIDESQNRFRVVTYIGRGIVSKLPRVLVEHSLPRDAHCRYRQ